MLRFGISEKGERMSDEKLQPCPFCDNKNFQIETDLSMGEPAQYLIVCDIHNGGCGASSGYRDTEKEAIKAWSTRADVSIGMSKKNALKETEGRYSDVLDKIYNSVEPKNIIAEFEVFSNGDIFENEQVLCDITIEDEQRGKYIVTIQEKKDA